jgi:hypothetical protein
VDAAPCQQAFGCYSCNAKAEAACQEEPFMIQNPSGLSFKGYKIHQGDFVLLQQPGTIQLGVGWIYGISFKRQQVYLDVTYWSIGCDPLNQVMNWFIFSYIINSFDTHIYLVLYHSHYKHGEYISYCNHSSMLCEDFHFS